MSWLSKKLKKVTNTVDPVGKYLRKSTGGSYGDPMNWYNSKPNTTQPWQPAPAKPLMAAPNGQQSLATTQLGGNSGGRTYAPNPFQNPMPQGSTAGSAMPAGPMKPSMSFGGPQMGNSLMQVMGGGQQPIQGNMQRGNGQNPLGNTGFGQSAINLIGSVMQPGAQPQPQNPQMQNQMLQAQMLRGGGRVM